MIEAALAAGAKTIIARDADLTVLEKPFGIRAIANALTSLADSGRIDKTRTGIYRLSRPSLHAVAGTATGSTPAS